MPRERPGELEVMETVERGRTVWRLDPLRRATDCAQGLAMLERRLAQYAVRSPARPSRPR